ncbi:diaminopimelate decarboxylase [Clostridium luticellarii]|jgi:diaminopimelate decarboxylase|uniref:Diaminopimelate decarboxylase n=1 Tax=Clostridium luticellarii TaxID=1691940 RepID=A0A2T0BNB9_9CLOT|nr:diaminopimelate decarboxylase [Clostridium luticellarii]MCI1945451.1 diaminopimelate decarboxylase [Clostridium luticellarii]MCI1968784.1 diaminopimelate decarboxylase [Clostridium luticellarii]MCI1994942.1 diaminopimelate decarboxylase [Clostridium luticellarii]MCI2040211.1 diaminopimelate decarboxylase [Clostridium luticellarii]PRR85375.1 Diaminopimelate decarboxylase [Clostridium luticellarii]
MRLFGNMKVKDDVLYIGGVSAEDLAKKFKTPLYVVDENLVRDKCKRYYRAFEGDKNNKITYAGKAFLNLAMCNIINSEKLYLDVVSGGELYTAFKSGFPMEKVYFHGNNKTPEEIEMGVRLGVGRFVVDNLCEMEKINSAAQERNKIQKVLLRVTPGIEAHTHDYIKTGQVDSKFGFTMLNGETMDVIKKARNMSNLKFVGIHCHIGSEIFEIKPYEDEVEIMLGLAKKIKYEIGYEIEELNLGGGFGIYYAEGDKPRSIEDFCSIILKKARMEAQKLNIKLPSLIIEPGRSIIGNAGTTLYTIGSIKNIPGIRKYVFVDGGMSDNIRPALYKASYECAVANKIQESGEETVTVGGKCCESGDILIKDVKLPKVETGDILAVFTTGAYCYSMASNYNKIPIPAVVLVKDGEAKLISKRQSFDEIIENEIMI